MKENESLTIFFNRNNQIDFTLNYFYKNIIPQIKYSINKTYSTHDEQYSDQDYLKYINNFRSYVRSKKTIYYIIIDGLEEIFNTPNLSSFISDLFDKLPLQSVNLKLLITGSKKIYEEKYPNLNKQFSEEITITGLSLNDTNIILKKNSIPPDYYSYFFKITRGFPGRIQTLLRLSKNHNNLSDLLQYKEYNDWISLDCEAVDVANPDIKSIISTITFTPNSLTINDLSQICKISSDNVINLIKTIDIIVVTEEKISFASEKHHNYFKIKLLNLKKITIEKLIEYYNNQDPITRAIQMPELLINNSMQSELLNFVETINPIEIIEKTKTVNNIIKILTLGINSSINQIHISQTYKFSYLCSILNGINEYPFFDSEVEALIELNDINSAIDLANTAVLNIDRLRLLVKIAKLIKISNQNIPNELMEQIEFLYKNNDLLKNDDKTIETISDLLYVKPKLAISILDKSIDKSLNFNEYIISRLTIAALDSQSKFQTDDSDITNELVKKIDSPEVNKIYKTLSLLIRDYNYEDILNEISALSSPDEKLSFIKIWLENINEYSNKYFPIIELYFELLIAASSEITIGIDFIILPAAFLKNIDNEKQYNFIKSKSTNIYKSISDSSSSLQIIKFHILLIENIKFNTKDQIEDILRICDKTIESTQDESIKLHSLVLIYVYVSNPARRIYNKDKRVLDYITKIKDIWNNILLNNAHHDHILKPSIQSLCTFDLDLSIELILRVNTLFRRELLFSLIFLEHLKKSTEDIFAILKKIEQNLFYAESKRYIQSKLIIHIEEKIDLAINHPEETINLFNKILLFRNTIEKCVLLTHCHNISIKSNADILKKKITDITNNLKETYERIDAIWDTVDGGFQVAILLSKTNTLLSKYFFNKAIDAKKNSKYNNVISAISAIYSVRLLIKSFSTLSTEKLDDSLFTNLESKINTIPSNTFKLMLYTDLGFQIKINENQTLFELIVNSKIIPLLHRLNVEKSEQYKILDSYTLIYILNQKTGEELIDKVFVDYKKEIYANIANFLITKESPFDLYDKESNKYLTNYSNLKLAIECIKKITDDATIYNLTKKICKSILDNKLNLAQLQINEVLELLINLCINKLPDLNNIKHNGYLILCKAEIFSCKKSNPTIFIPELINDAKQISNTSDRIYVNSILLNILKFESKSLVSLKTSVYDSIIVELDLLRNKYEYVSRVTDVSPYISDLKPNGWREILKNAFNSLNHIPTNNDTITSKRELMDAAYSFDSNYAGVLLKQLDEDNKNYKSIKMITNRFELLELTEKLKNDGRIFTSKKYDEKQILDAIYSCYKSLNSDKINPKPLPDLIHYFKHLSSASFGDLYYLFAYYLLSCRKTKLNNKDKIEKNLDLSNFSIINNSISIIDLSTSIPTIQVTNTNNNTIQQQYAIHNIRSHNETIELINNWLSENTSNYILFIDPYFTVNSLNFFKIIQANSNISTIKILCSELGKLPEFKSKIHKYWKSISDQKPPRSLFIFCYFNNSNKKSPIHDRYILSETGGLRFGSSLNAIGGDKDSEVSIINKLESQAIYTEIYEDYFNLSKTEVNGIEILYEIYTFI